MAHSRFESVEVDQFIDLKKNYNTKRKTSSDVALFQRFLKEIHDIDEDLKETEPELLNNYMAEFFVNVRKSDGQQYELLSLRSFFASFNRYQLKSLSHLCFTKLVKPLRQNKNTLKASAREVNRMSPFH